MIIKFVFKGDERTDEDACTVNKIQAISDIDYEKVCNDTETRKHGHKYFCTYLYPET